LTLLITLAVFMIVTAFIILRELVSGRAVRPAWAPVTATPLAKLAADAAAEPGDPDDPGDPGPGGRRPANDAGPMAPALTTVPAVATAEPEPGVAAQSVPASAVAGPD
ncbi:hypothetical protein J8J27_24845, partial [Mycobacterium tuberculosis]|nr:hypothetical protein [Mycobacterium tuberculosis]